jgi:hypothetical protein
MDEQGFDVEGFPYASDFSSVHQGDDCATATLRPIDGEQLTQTCALFGFTIKAIPGDVFLSRHQVDGHEIPIAGRIVQQMMSNEHEPTGRHCLGILYLGADARLTGSERLPSRYKDAIWRCIRNASWIEETGVKSFDGLRVFLRSSSARAQIEQDLQHAANAAWLRQETRAADYKYTAAAILAAARAVGLDPSAADSDDLKTDAIIRASVGIPWSTKRFWASEGWAAINSGHNATADWLARIANEVRVNVDPTDTILRNAIIPDYDEGGIETIAA